MKPRIPTRLLRDEEFLGVVDLGDDLDVVLPIVVDKYSQPVLRNSRFNIWPYPSSFQEPEDVPKLHRCWGFEDEEVMDLVLTEQAVLTI